MNGVNSIASLETPNVWASLQFILKQKQFYINKEWLGISTGIAKLDRKKKCHQQPMRITFVFNFVKVYTYDNMLRHMSAHKCLFLFCYECRKRIKSR